MILIAHIAAALLSIAYTTYLFISPSRANFFVNYGLIGLTLASGTYLVVSSHSRLLPACTAGLIYIGCISVATALARSRFIRAK